MTPVRSNLNTQTPVVISSNGITWEGENIDCIDLCKGDTVSDVVYKLALQVCAAKELLDLTDFDLGCLTEGDPEKTLITVLGLLKDKVCELEGLIPGEVEDTEELVVTVASCFIENDENNDPVTQLPLHIYAQRIGSAFCALKTIVTSHTSTLENHEDRIEALENETPASTTIPNLIPTCTFDDEVARPVDTILAELESQFCDIKGALGSAVSLATSVSTQCQGLKDEAALATSGNMSGISGWTNNPTTVAQSLGNLWLTICDMRAFMKNIGECCKPSCDAVIVDFSVAVDEDRTELTLFFAGLTDIPDGFEECSQAGSKLTITDSAGHKYITYVDVVDNQAEVDGVTIDLTSTTINPNLTYTIVLDACVTKDGVQCNKTITKTDIPPCGVATSVVASLV